MNLFKSLNLLLLSSALGFATLATANPFDSCVLFNRVDLEDGELAAQLNIDPVFNLEFLDRTLTFRDILKNPSIGAKAREFSSWVQANSVVDVDQLIEKADMLGFEKYSVYAMVRDMSEAGKAKKMPLLYISKNTPKGKPPVLTDSRAEAQEMDYFIHNDGSIFRIFSGFVPGKGVLEQATFEIMQTHLIKAWAWVEKVQRQTWVYNHILGIGSIAFKVSGDKIYPAGMHAQFGMDPKYKEVDPLFEPVKVMEKCHVAVKRTVAP